MLDGNREFEKKISQTSLKSPNIVQKSNISPQQQTYNKTVIVWGGLHERRSTVE